MQVIREALRRLAGLVYPGRRDRELQDELQLHLDLAAEAARRRGHSPEEAARLAAVQAGGVAQAMESLRDQRGVPVFAGLSQDLRMAARALRASPLVTAVAVLSLALAIGANTAIFSIVNSLLLRDLPVRDPGSLAHVTDSVRRDTGEIRIRAWSNPFWEQLRARPHLFARTTAWSFTRFNVASGGETQLVEGMWADGGLFETLGVEAVLGRTFSELDDRPGGGPDGPVAVLGYGYWQRQFGGGVDAIGRTVRLNGTLFTIVGVTPAAFFGLEVGRSFDVIVPLRTEALIRGVDSVLASPSTNFLSILARVQPGRSIEAAAADLRGAQADMVRTATEAWGKEEADHYLVSPFTVIPARGGFSSLRRDFERPLLVIATVVALVLLIGCVTVANLLVARAIARRHELSVQVALGASRWRLARQMFAESVALSAVGAVLGVALASAGSRFLIRQLSTPANPVMLDLSIDARVLVFTIAVAALTALLFGTAPAFRVTRAQPAGALNERGRSGVPQDRGSVMSWLMAVQVALSTVLIVSAGLFVRSFVSLADRDLGFEPGPVLVGTLDPARSSIAPPDRVAFFERVREAVLQVPDVADAAISFLTPVGGGGFTPPVEVTTPAGPARMEANAEVFGNLISPGWFRTFGTPVTAGRDFTDADRRGATRVAIVNEAFASRFLPGGSPLGRSLTIFPGTPRALRVQVVGVVVNAVYTSPHQQPPPTWYLPIGQFDVAGFPFSQVRLSVRARDGSPALLNRSVAAAIVGVDPRLSVTFRSADDQVRGSLRHERLMAQLAGFFGVLALLLASLGLYGVTAHAVARRRAEIGLRMALGAAPRDILGAVLGRVSLPLVAGIAAGGAISAWAAKFIGGLLYGLVPRDPATLIGSAAMLLLVGLAAGWLPARRAMRIDPAAVLREG